jgi:hypothetical protein
LGKFEAGDLARLYVCGVLVLEDDDDGGLNLPSDMPAGQFAITRLIADYSKGASALVAGGVRLMAFTALTSLSLTWTGADYWNNPRDESVLAALAALQSDRGPALESLSLSVGPFNCAKELARAIRHRQVRSLTSLSLAHRRCRDSRQLAQRHTMSADAPSADAFEGRQRGPARSGGAADRQPGAD